MNIIKRRNGGVVGYIVIPFEIEEREHGELGKLVDFPFRGIGEMLEMGGAHGTSRER